MGRPLLQIQDLQMAFHTPTGKLKALRGINLTVNRGQIFGIVGESGCGKTMTARAILGLVPHPGEVTAGHVLYDGEDLLRLNQHELRKYRGKRIAMIFQNPQAALNPLFTIGEQISAVMKQNRGEADIDKIIDLIRDTGLPNPDKIIKSYPHRLSGGMQQRVMIAMALSSEPELLIADEPTTALDVTIQAQILELLTKLKEEKGLTILFVTHNMGVVAETCDSVAVIYAGKVVEQGTVRDIFHSPKHPYTQGLLATLPHPGSRGKDLATIPGVVPSGFEDIPGCPFASRCRYVMDICHEQQPKWTEVKNGSTDFSHKVVCFLHE
ncbi:ABC transporter ATP-binding protein [Thermodesulfobacteriota bacterium]